MRERIQRWLTSAFNALSPPRNRAQEQRIQRLEAMLDESAERESRYRADYVERASELIEAKQMAGSGPWLVAEARGSIDHPGRLREASPISSQGAYGDIALALENVEWRREINLSWLEFSRWGIQQIILVTRLYYIKNPIIRRLIDVCAAYVFARGVEISSPDKDANTVLDEFFELNKSVLGKKALTELEKAKDYDGNLFFAFFADKINTGAVTVRTIDATEIQDIITDPEDTAKPRFYRRVWTERIFNEKDGSTSSAEKQAWYPALGYEPEAKIPQINTTEVRWDSPVMHSKAGGVAKWLFGCPRMYPALDWSRTAKKWLEWCATVKQSLAQVSMTLTTKGGQQAMEGAKQQLSTTVGPNSSLWDQNPTAVNGSIFASGPGTKLEAFNTSNAGGDPEECRQFKLMCCMVAGVPETFLADVSTGNLATATSLDRPTETVMEDKQESWREDLGTIAIYVLKINSGAASGRLIEAREAASKANRPLVIRETPRKYSRALGKMVYDESYEAKPGEVLVKVNFPAIREGDQQALVGAIADAMTLGNKGGQVVGIDEKAGVRKLYDAVGIEDGDELTEQQYPDGEYDPDRTKEVLPDPIPKMQELPGGSSQVADKPVQEALTRVARALRPYVELSNGR